MMLLHSSMSKHTFLSFGRFMGLRPDQANAMMLHATCPCYMLQCRMRHNRIYLAIAFHATCCKFLSSMLHATRMNMFIIVACSMLQIFSVVFVWPHHATKSKENSLMTQENVQIKARIFC